MKQQLPAYHLHGGKKNDNIPSQRVPLYEAPFLYLRIEGVIFGEVYE